MLPSKIATQKKLLIKALRALDRIEELEECADKFKNLDITVEQIKKEEIIDYADAITDLAKELHEQLTCSNVVGSWNVVIAAEQYYQN